MINDLSKKFGTYAIGAVLALSSAFATPAMAGNDFLKKDLRAETTKVVELVGSSLSKDKLTFVVHGGNNKLMGAAYRVAQRLDDENIPVAFLLGPEHDNNINTSHVDFYTKGGTKYYSIGFDNSDMGKYESGMYEQAMKAVNDDFPEYTSVSGGQPTVASARILASNQSEASVILNKSLKDIVCACWF